MMANSEYENLIALLRQILQFYANEENYEPNSDMIEKDMGTQARFALERIKEFGVTQKDNIEEYIKQVEENLDNTSEIDDLYKTLQQVKKLADDEVRKRK